jgi:DNA-binding transcriptional ArsR family regulator
MIEYTEEIQHEPKLKDLCVYSVKEQSKKINTRLSKNKTVKTIWKYLKATEYIDLKTGEILSEKEAQKLGVTELDYGLYVETRKQILAKLRKEVRQLATFVLKFRNKRRGITPDLSTVMKYYSELNNKRYDNVTRHREDLYSSIMVDDYLCRPEFQFTGKQVTTKEHTCESSHAGNVLFFELLRELAQEELSKTTDKPEEN